MSKCMLKRVQNALVFEAGDYFVSAQSTDICSIGRNQRRCGGERPAYGSQVDTEPGASWAGDIGEKPRRRNSRNPARRVEKPTPASPIILGGPKWDLTAGIRGAMLDFSLMEGPLLAKDSSSNSCEASAKFWRQTSVLLMGLVVSMVVGASATWATFMMDAPGRREVREIVKERLRPIDDKVDELVKGSKRIQESLIDLSLKVERISR